MQSLISTLITTILGMVTSYVGIMQVLNGEMTLGGYMAFSTLSSYFTNPVSELVGLQMSIQELGTILEYNIDVKIILLNNNYLGMVRQWQELFFDERYSETHLKNPDFVKIAEAYGIRGRKVTDRKELDSAIEEMLSHKGAYLLEAVVETKGMVYPMVPAGGSVTDILIGNGHKL